MKKRVVHYTIGFHYPSRGGVETYIHNFFKMTGDFYESIVVCKNGGDIKGGVKTVCSISKNGNTSNYHKKYSYLFPDNVLPQWSTEFDEQTINIINSLNPDILIVYGNDFIEMLIVLVECKASRKFLRIQRPILPEMEFLKKYPEIEILVFNPNHIPIINDELKMKNTVHYIPHSFDDSLFYPKHNDRSDVKRINFLYTGRISKNKQTKELVNVFNKIILDDKIDVGLDIVGGTFNFAYYNEVINTIKTGNIVIQPWCEHSKLAEIYRQHECVVIPSYTESFCASALEALASGCIVVMNTTSSGYWNKGLVVNGCHLLNEEPSEKTLYEGVNYVIKHFSELRSKTIKNAEYVRLNYSFTSVKDKWLSLLSS